MAYVRHDREQAAAQIQRSLRVWRKVAAGALDGPVASPADGGDGKAAMQGAPAIGAELQPGAVSLARKNDKPATPTPAPRPQHTPLTDKAADDAAAALGFARTNERSRGQPVLRMGRRYITPDVDGHNGGVWKMADSVENLGSKQTRMGTYDAQLRRVGD